MLNITSEAIDAALDLILDNEKNGKSIPGRLMDLAFEMSETDDQSDFLKEWTVWKVDDEGVYCTCGHEIMYRYWIANKKTNKVLICGSECVTKFGDRRLRQEADAKRLVFSMQDSGCVSYNMKYTGHYKLIRRGKHQYTFRLRTGTKLYKALEGINGSDYDYCGFTFRNDECYIKLIHKYPAKYTKDEWYNLYISMTEIGEDTQAIIFNFRKAPQS